MWEPNAFDPVVLLFELFICAIHLYIGGMIIAILIHINSVVWTF